MPKVAVHIDPETHKVAGVWVWGIPPEAVSGAATRGQPEAYYVGSEYQRQLAAAQVRARGRDSSWDDWCESKAQSLPVKIWWECADGVADESPEQAYKRLTAKAK